MGRYTIPIPVKYEKDDWLSENQTCVVTKNDITQEYVSKTIEENLKKADEFDIIEISFSGIDVEKKEDLLKAAYEYVDRGKVKDIKITTRPNCINKSFLKMLKKYKIKTIELEVCSTNNYILNNLKIDYNFKDIKKASKAIRWHGFKLGYQIFVGVPESTRLDDVNTVKTLLKLKPNYISITPVLVLKDTPLESEYKEEKYKPLAVIQAVETCIEMVKLLNEKGIETISIGYGILDNNIEQLEIAKEIKEGPFHPSFRELVESGLWYDAVVNKIKKLNVKVSKVEVTVNSIDLKNVIGYKQENITKLKDIYDVDLVITADESIRPGKSKIEVIEKF